MPLAAKIVPLLAMPPPALVVPNCATLLTLMPAPVAPVAEIVPALLMSPVKVETPLTRMPVPAAEMVPALLMPPGTAARSNRRRRWCRCRLGYLRSCR